MDEFNNNRRDDASMRRLFAEVEKQGRECHDQYGRLDRRLHEMSQTQALFSQSIVGITTSVNEIKNLVLPMAQSDAVQKQQIQGLDRSVEKIYGMIGVDRDKQRAPARGSMSPEAIKWVVIGLGIILVAVLMSFGALSANDVKDLKNVSDIASIEERTD